MKEDLQHLLALQEIDLESLRLREQLILYPPMLKRLEKNLSRKKREQESLVEKKKEGQKSRRSMEKEIEFLEEQVNKKLQQQLFPKIKQDAYDTLKHEIDRIKDEISRIEDRALESITAEEALDKAIKDGNQRLKIEEEDARIERERINNQVKTKNKDSLNSRKKENPRSVRFPSPSLLITSAFTKATAPTWL